MEVSSKTTIKTESKCERDVKKKIVKLLDAYLIYLNYDNPCVSLVYVVPKKRRVIMAMKKKNKLILTHIIIREMMKNQVP